MKKKGIRAFFGRVFNGKKWNETRTRKKMLFLSIGLVLLFTTIMIILLAFEKSLDSTLTEQFFGYCKWLVGGCLVLVFGDTAKDMAKILKGQDEEEEE